MHTRLATAQDDAAALVVPNQVPLLGGSGGRRGGAAAGSVLVRLWGCARTGSGTLPALQLELDAAALAGASGEAAPACGGAAGMEASEAGLAALRRLDHGARVALDWPVCAVPRLAVVERCEPWAALQPLACVLPMARCALRGGARELELLAVPMLALDAVPRPPRAPPRGIALRTLLGGEAAARARLADELVGRGFAVVDVSADGALPAPVRALYELFLRYAAVAERDPGAEWFETFHSGGKFLGFSRGLGGRPFWQQRRPRGPWPPRALSRALRREAPRAAGCEGLPAAAMEALAFFEAVAEGLLAALLAELRVAPLIPPPAGSALEPFGPGVLRTYLYRSPSNVALRGAREERCGLHADLGLLTISPCASAAGLEIVDARSGETLDCHAACGPGQLLVFGGETLGKLTDGMVRPALHQVRPESAHGEDRLSCVYFQRGEPEARFPDDSGNDIKSFTLGRLFSHRWWRTPPEDSAKNLDY
jgi:hypothetical protein